MKIQDFEVGRTIGAVLLVKEASILRTKPPKNAPYLNATLSDGISDIKAIMWDFYEAPPEKGSVVMLAATVGEYMGTKQLTLNKIEPSSVSPNEFMPKWGGLDPKRYSERLDELIQCILCDELRYLITAIINDHMKAFTTLPAAKGIHHAYLHGLLKHSVDVADKAVAIAGLIPDANMDLIIAGALIHDIGKVHTYTMDSAVIDTTMEAALFEHIVSGLRILEGYRTESNYMLVHLLEHIITSHHGKLEYGSPMTPKFLEAHIIHAADSIDAKTQTILELNRRTTPDDIYTEKEWTLDNKPQFTIAYIQKVMEAYQ